MTGKGKSVCLSVPSWGCGESRAENHGGGHGPVSLSHTQGGHSFLCAPPSALVWPEQHPPLLTSESGLVKSALGTQCIASFRSKTPRTFSGARTHPLPLVLPVSASSSMSAHSIITVLIMSAPTLCVRLGVPLGGTRLFISEVAAPGQVTLVSRPLWRAMLCSHS